MQLQRALRPKILIDQRKSASEWHATDGDWREPKEETNISLGALWNYLYFSETGSAYQSDSQSNPLVLLSPLVLTNAIANCQFSKHPYLSSWFSNSIASSCRFSIWENPTFLVIGNSTTGNRYSCYSPNSHDFNQILSLAFATPPLGNNYGSSFHFTPASLCIPPRPSSSIRPHKNQQCKHSEFNELGMPVEGLELDQKEPVDSCFLVKELITEYLTKNIYKGNHNLMAKWMLWLDRQ